MLFPGTCKSSHTTNPTSELTGGSRPQKNDFFGFSEPLESSPVIFFHVCVFPLLKYHSLLGRAAQPTWPFLLKASQGRFYTLMIPGSHQGCTQAVFTRDYADQNFLLPKIAKVGGRGLMETYTNWAPVMNQTVLRKIVWSPLGKYLGARHVLGTGDRMRRKTQSLLSKRHCS